jgi:hypothetical protein
MGYVHFNLVNSATCAAMAPPPLIGGGFGVANLPPGMAGWGAGSYIIVNTNTNNRYAGISGNLTNRFNTRMAVVTEMGFAPATMALIGVCWGHTYVRNTAPALAGWAAGAPLPGGVLVPPAPPAAFAALIDGAAIHLEHLLIRFCATQLGAGGTISNNVLMAPYANPAPNDILVRLSYGAMGGLFAAGAQQSVWVAGGPAW